VRWVDLDPTRESKIRETRSAVVLTAGALNRARHIVVVVPLSTGSAPRSPIVVATPSAGAGNVAVCDHVGAVDKGRLIQCAGVSTTVELRTVEDGARVVLEL